MENMQALTFEEILAHGQAKLAAQRAATEAAQAAQDAQNREEQAKHDAHVQQCLAAIFPAALLPYIEIGEHRASSFDIPLTINAPECAPISCALLNEAGKLNRSQEPFGIPDVWWPEGHYRDDPDAPWPQWMWGRNTIMAKDIATALAHARSNWIQFQLAQAAYAEWEAEKQAQRDAVQAARVVSPDEIRVENATAAVIEPTLGDRLIKLIEDVMDARDNRRLVDYSDY